MAQAVCDRLPRARLAGVARVRDEILGVVYRPSKILSEDEYLVKVWLVQLQGIESGNLRWDDFIPSCKKCHAKLLPVLDEQCSCSVCGGRMGPKKCVQFECRGGLELSTCDLFRCEPSKRQAYCGSHPFFGGYSAIEPVHGDAGPALWEEKLDSTEGFEVVMTASRFWEGAGDGYGWHTEAHIFADRLQDTRCTRVQVRPDGKSILTPTQVKMGGQLSAPVSSAVVLAESPCHGQYILLQRWGNSSCIIRRATGKDTNKWTEVAELSCPDVCKDFKRQIVEICYPTHNSSAFLVGLSKKSLWIMEVPRDDLAYRMDLTTAQQLASQVQWRKLMDLPGVDADNAERADGEGDWDEDESRPPRFISRGPRSDQVIIFAESGSFLQPWLLVEIGGATVGTEIRTALLTSIASVPLQRKEAGAKHYCSAFDTDQILLLPSVLRMERRHAGYLFFDGLGQIYRLRDEEIMLAEHAWSAPSFISSASQRLVTFSFHESDAKRSCLFSVLERFEYFQKAFGQWQEGHSSEMCIVDVEPETFDVFLQYLHAGRLGVLPLQTWLSLLQLGNKYVMHHLMAVSMARILGILDDEERLGQEKPTVLADLLAFASKCGDVFKLKVMDAIACNRSSLVVDKDFLARVSSCSVDALSHLLDSLLKPDRCFDCPEAKRRKAHQTRQAALWRHASEAPSWSGL